MLLLGGASFGCEPAAPPDAPDGQPQRRADGRVQDDRSLCEWKNRRDVEVTETAGTGAFQPNVRRVHLVLGTGAEARRQLICREVDTNLDGLKDVVRTYTPDGQTKEERADTNHDGRIDTWNVFSKGRLAEVQLDRNHDGKPDEWKTYTEGQVSRVKRDANFDGLLDVWEMYRDGRLERMGVDLDGDERVDRWDHDSQWRRALERTEKAREEQEARERKERDDEARREATDVDEANPE